MNITVNTVQQHNSKQQTLRTSMRVFWLGLTLLVGRGDALASTKAVKPPTHCSSSIPSQLSAVSQTQLAALDGAEWASLEAFLMQQGAVQMGKYSQIGYMTVVTGITENQERVVGIQALSTTEQHVDVVVSLDSKTNIYADSKAIIPQSISDQDAISTLVGSLVGIHCTLPKLDQVGGAPGESFVSGKVVVIGSNDYACFCSKGLSALGAKVVQVSTKSPKIPPNHQHVQLMTPGVGELNLGFCNVVGEFDSLLDTIDDEAKLSNRNPIENNDPYGSVGGVVAELSKQHKCHRYVSTLSHSQRIVRNAGVLWGPGKANSHMNDMSQKIASGSSDAQPIVPPNDFGKTLQTLLDHQITWKAAPTQRNLLARGWSLADFWEQTSWPRDTAGRGETRYGLPVQDLEETIQERMISEPPGIKSRFSEYKETYSEEEEAEMEKEVAAYALDQNVLTIRGVDGLQRDVIAAEKDCLLFLSAPWCRTCRYLSPQYTRMARENSSNVTFAKADTTGTMGKALGKALQVDAVPTFVLFRRGRVYGSPLSVSRLPSKKLEQAVDYLAAGKGWDDALLAEDL